MAVLLGAGAMIRAGKKSKERGAMLLELLLILVLAGGLFYTAAPVAVNIYQYGAVRFEAEHLLSEIRREQMAARTAARQVGEDGGTEYLGSRPRLMLTGKGYICYRGDEETMSHACLPSVRMQFKGDWEGKKQLLYFGADGDIYPGITILIFASGGENIYCCLIIDTAGRVRLERGDANG